MDFKTNLRNTLVNQIVLLIINFGNTSNIKKIPPLYPSQF